MISIVGLCVEIILLPAGRSQRLVGFFLRAINDTFGGKSVYPLAETVEKCVYRFGPYYYGERWP